MPKSAPTSMKDNTYGRGYVAPPSTLRSLGRFSDALRPTNWISHKVQLASGRHSPTTHLVTIPAGDFKHAFSFMANDLEWLLRFGLVRIQSNDPGQVTFYFADKYLKNPRRGQIEPLSFE